MKGIIGIYIFISFIFAFIVLFLYFRIISKLISRMRERHVDLWEQLGQPKLDSSLSPKNAFNVVVFFLRKDHLKFNDLELTKICNSASRKFYIFTFITLTNLLLLFTASFM